MNHYERLKVSQDAPAEVIRAAYRALASKLHPDRQGAETHPNDETHAQMAALNAAYETLIDPKLRQDYDATLGPLPHLAPAGLDGAHHAQQAEPSSRVDMDWLTPKSAVAQPLWPPSRRMMVIGGCLAGAMVLPASFWFWQMLGQHQMERALSDQYAARPADQRAAQGDAEAPEAALPQARVPTQTAQAEAQGAPPLPGSAALHRPTVAELSRMSDEELLQVLPTLDSEQPSPAISPRTRPASVRRAQQHPLDGKPLNLRTDSQLVDPLAPLPAAQPGIQPSAQP